MDEVGVDMELDVVLRQRFVPSVRVSLAEKIISEAKKHQQITPQAAVTPLQKAARSQSSRAISWWAGFWDSFVLPQPTLVMSIVLLLGLFIGANIDFGDNTIKQQEEAATYYALSDDLDVRSWL